MSGFEITKMDTAEIGSWDFAALKTGFAAALKEYSTHVYTDEASAKADKAELNKVKKIIEDKRKEYKKQCLAPYETAEKQVKELVAMIEIEQERITNSLDAFETDRKNQKEAEIKEYYDKKSAPLGEYAEKMFRKLLNKSWLAASSQRKKWESEVVLAIASAAEDIRKLNVLGTPYVSTLVDLYIGGYTLEQCIEKNNEYVGVNETISATVEESAVQPEPVVTEQTVPEGAVTVRMNSSPKQVEQVLDFMKLIGVGFEIL